MELLWLIIAFIAGAVTSIGLLKRFGKFGHDPKQVEGTPSIAESIEKRPTEDQLNLPSLTTELYALAESLDAQFDQAAHPRDLTLIPDFQRAVSILTNARFSNIDVLQYYTGNNYILASLAAEALYHRDRDANASDQVLAHIKNIGPWVMYFALKYLDSFNQKPIIGTVLTHSADWWLDNPGMQQVIGEFIDRRMNATESAEFDLQLEACSREKLATISNFLKSLKSDTATALSAKIRQLQRTQIDTATLNSIGRTWVSTDANAYIVEHDLQNKYLDKLERTLTSSPPRSVLLIGELGVGKTTLVQALSVRLQSHGWTIFEASAADVLAGQVYIGELEGRVKDLLQELDRARHVLWYVPDFNELIHAGSHKYEPRGLLDLILPAIASNRILIIGELQPQAYERLIQARKRLRTAMEAIYIAELGDQETLAVAQKWATMQADRDSGIVIPLDTISEAQLLAKQHLVERHAPGNLLEFLKLTRAQLLAEGKPISQMGSDHLLKTLAQLTGLPTTILDDKQDLDISGLRRLFQTRVIGQTEALDALVERVAMIKAGLTDPSRPLGVFLFAGPTGTGKTEIAKTLSKFLFGAEERMIRLDMSEFQSVDSVNRILSERHPDENAQALVNQIRKQPFSVILLDEFEKAHPNIWDLFLQVFDDARLTDRLGNTADFRHAIIILTSNLGATISAGASIGFTAEKGTFSKSSVEKAISNNFRREFINRLDRIVIFHPLSRNIMREILHKELDNVLQRRGLRKREWAVEWEESAIEFLLDKGFTPDLGARPLKRAIERYLLAPLALTIVEHEFPEGDQFLFVRSDGANIRVMFIDPDASDSKEGYVAPARSSATETVRLKTIAQEAHGLEEEFVVLSHYMDKIVKLLEGQTWLENKRVTLAQMKAADFWDSTDRYKVLSKIEFMDRIESGFKTAKSLWHRLSQSHAKTRSSGTAELVQRLAQRLYLLDIACSDYLHNNPTDAFVLVEAHPDKSVPISASVEFFDQIKNMYLHWGRKRQMRHQTLKEAIDGKGNSHVLMSISGFGAYSILKSETGLHVMEIPKKDKAYMRCKVHVSVAPQPDETPLNRTELIAMADAVLAAVDEGALEIVRRYRKSPSPLVRDSIRNWRTGRLQRVLNGDFDLIE